MYYDRKIYEISSMPDIILFANSDKGAIDTVDQLCYSYSFPIKTRRWFVAYFVYNINLAVFNVFLCWRYKKSRLSKQ